MLVARTIRKRFGPVTALDGVDFSAAAGEVHALLGENGAGKSTLVKCLAGVHRPDAGGMMLGGGPFEPTSPSRAERMGVATVFQEVGLIAHLTVGENICLGREPTHRWAPGVISRARTNERARAAMARLGVDIDPAREMSSCSMAQRQLVAIGRALDVSARVLILDEPTSSLDKGEVVALMHILRRLRSQGMAIVFVTHFLGQVYDIADRVTVLRDGVVAGAAPIAEMPRERLVSLMIGREVTLASSSPPSRGSGDAPVLVEARGLSRPGALEHVDLTIRRGEAMGLAGLLGSGRSETARALAGVDPATSGEIRVDGARVRLDTPRRAIRLGIAFAPEDRRSEGLFPGMSVRENITIAMRARGASKSDADAAARDLIRRLRIKAPDPEAPVSTLSGGNQQKVILARWLAARPRLLVLDEPTRGIDIGAKAEILAEIARLREHGLSVLFISSELSEVLGACDRVTVLRDRRTVDVLEGDQRREDAVLAAIAASHAPEAAHA